MAAPTHGEHPSHCWQSLAQYFTQTGHDRMDGGDQYIANMRDGATAGFKYFAFDGTESLISVEGTGNGQMEVSDGEQLIAKVPVNGQAAFRVNPGVKPLYFPILVRIRERS